MGIFSALMNGIDFLGYLQNIRTYYAGKYDVSIDVVQVIITNDNENKNKAAAYLLINNKTKEKLSNDQIMKIINS